jgi:hypothetical protein
MTPSLKTALMSALLSCGVLGPVAHADVVAPAPGQGVIDTAPRLTWARFGTPADGQAKGYRLATVTELRTMLLNRINPDHTAGGNALGTTALYNLELPLQHQPALSPDTGFQNAFDQGPAVSLASGLGDASSQITSSVVVCLDLEKCRMSEYSDLTALALYVQDSGSGLVPVLFESQRKESHYYSAPRGPYHYFEAVSLSPTGSSVLSGWPQGYLDAAGQLKIGGYLMVKDWQPTPVSVISAPYEQSFLTTPSSTSFKMAELDQTGTSIKGSFGFPLVLSTVPAGPVTAKAVRTGGDLSLTLDPDSVTFSTPAAWSQVSPRQTLGFHGTANPTSTLTANFSFQGEGVSPSALTVIQPAGVDVNITGTDVYSVAIPNAGGTSAPLMVTLKAAPTQTVEVKVVSNPNSPFVANKSTLTFTPANWNVAQAVTFSGPANTKSGDLSSDFYINQVRGQITQDNYGLIVSTKTLTVSPITGISPPVSMRLPAAPADNVVVTVALAPNTGATPLAPNPSTLTFTPTNWNTPQTVTFTGPIKSTSYTPSGIFLVKTPGFSDRRLVVNEPPYTPPPELVLSQSTVAIPTSVGSVPITVALSSAPSADRTVTITRTAGDAYLNALPLSLTFTPDNWSTKQTVTISGPINPQSALSATFSLQSADSAPATLTATEAAFIPPVDCALTYKVLSTGNASFTSQITLTNLNSTAAADWSVAWGYGFATKSLLALGAKVAGVDGAWTATPTIFNRTLAAKKAVSFSFIGTKPAGSTLTAPFNLRWPGHNCTVTQP